MLWQAESAEAQADLPSFRAGFKDVGYAEGDLIFEDRFWGSASRGSSERLDLMAKELVDLKCDVLVGVAILSALALRRHTITIPIVFVYNPNPTGSGLVKSLSHPGGNVTGVTQVHLDLSAKRVELLRDTIPALASLAMIRDSSPSLEFANRPELEDTRTAANQLGLSFQSFECNGPDGLEEAFSKASRFGAAILGNSHWVFLERKRVAELAIAGKLAVMGPASLMVEATSDVLWSQLVDGRAVGCAIGEENSRGSKA
ncbi:MAG TPA: ABC transporter substrate-binding protein [Candidatus Acidoferrum sp.]|nr:ABC transporter substrate-binding protein [Candidatus Acidoferrum sp.]